MPASNDTQTAHLAQLLTQGPQCGEGRAEGELLLGGAHLGPRSGSYAREGHLNHGTAGSVRGM